MIQFHFWKPRCVERNCIFTCGRFEELALADEQELSFRINEAADQPWAGDTIHFDIFTSNPFHNRPRIYRRLLGTSHGLVHHHSRDWFSVLLLLRRVNAVGLRIDGETVDSVLDAKVVQFAVMIWIVLMENANGAAVTRDI